MSPALEVRHVVERELRRNLLSVKGVLLVLLSLFGGTFTALAMLAFAKAQVSEAQAAGVPEEAMSLARAKVLGFFYGDEATVRHLVDAPIPLVVLLWLSVWLSPALVWLAGFDSLSGELQHRTVRFFLPRTRRASHYVGKMIGLWLTTCVMTFVMHAFLWVVTLAKGDYGFAATLGWGVRFWLVVALISAAWSGLATLVASLSGAPSSSLLLVGVAFFAVFFAGFLLPRSFAGSGREELAQALSFLYPNGYDRWLLSPRPEHAAVGLAGTVALAAGPTALGARLFSVRDV